MRYAGLTHALPLWLLPLWKRIMCRRNCHVFDEVETDVDHYLVCDACDLVVHIARIETSGCRYNLRGRAPEAADDAPLVCCDWYTSFPCPTCRKTVTVRGVHE